MNFQEVHSFWFGDDIHKNPLKNREMWWKRPAGIDELITKVFSPALMGDDGSELNVWKNSPEGFVSLIVLLDQFPRHIFRGKPESFAFDSVALEICFEGLQDHIDKKLHWAERQFFLLPLEHSENLAVQERSVQEFEILVKDTPKEFFDYIDDNREAAVKHYDIIKRFGRFPHRNKILGRESTSEEIEFLKQPGSSF